MIKRIVLLLTLEALLVATAAEAVVPGKGKRGRNLERAMYYSTQLENDKLSVYGQYGYPVHRIRERFAGKVTERWSYYESGVEFTFDENSRIVKTRNFSPENRRARIERFPESKR